MIKMLIADDEEMIVNGLMTIWDWSKYNIEIVGTAKDGQEALDKCLLLKPDILLTDINMPRLHGIEVAQALKEQGITIYTIIISGIKDFNFAKDAIALNAYGYLLKPIKIPELKRVFEEVTQCILDHKKQKKDMTHLKHLYEENLPVLRSSFLRNLLQGVYQQEPVILHKSQQLSLPLHQQDNFQVGMVDIEHIPDSFHGTADKGLFLFSILNIVEEIVGQSGLCFQINDAKIAIIFFASPSENQQLSSHVLQACSDYLDVILSIGLGTHHRVVMGLHDSYKKSIDALEYRFYTGNHLVIAYNDIVDTSSEISEEELLTIQNTLLHTILLGHKEKCLSLLKDFSQQMQKRAFSRTFIQTLCLETIVMIYRKIEETQEDIASRLEDKFLLLKRLSTTNHLESLVQELETLSLQCCEAIFSKNNSKNNYIVEEIISIIHDKYNTKLTVNDMASYVNLTPNYVSQIFKKHEGISFNQYLTKYRIEKAKALLHKSDFKIYEVAEMVGFESPYYFSTVFKKHTGYHPSMYKDL